MQDNVLINAFHAAGECRRQANNFTKYSTNYKILEFHDHIWNHHAKCIQTSTNMPSIDSLIREIEVKISEKNEKANTILLSKTKVCVLRVKGLTYSKTIIDMG